MVGPASKQGWDQAAIDVACVIRRPGADNLTCEPLAGGTGRPSDTEVRTLREAGVTGTLQPSGGVARLRLGPRAHSACRVGPADFRRRGVEATARHTSVIYVQNRKDWKLLPAGAPLMDRPIVLETRCNAPHHTMVYVKDVDGSLTGGSCGSWK